MRILPALLLLSCVPPPSRPAEPAPRPDPRRDVDRALASLEASFYDHWGSVEAREEVRRLGPRHVKALRERVDVNGAHALLALRVLERVAPGEAAITAGHRAILYVSALRRERNFLRWGTITGAGFFPGVYGKELVDQGDAVTEPLTRLLEDRRRAPVVGRKVGRENDDQRDRVCDYAWVLLCEIHDRPLVYHRDPRSRDDEIRRFELWLQRGR